MNMGLVNSHIAHWMQQQAGNSIRNVSLGTPRTMDVCLNGVFFLLPVMFQALRTNCITAPPRVVAYSVTSTSISFIIVQQDISKHIFLNYR